jgi:hypothetical protein
MTSKTYERSTLVRILFASLSLITIQIQPAYSQSSHCVNNVPRGITCITPGQDPSKTSCERGSTTIGGFMCQTTNDLTHQEAGQA